MLNTEIPPWHWSHSMSGKAPKPDCLHLAINHTAAVGFKHLPGQINFISLRVLVIITGKTCIGRIQHILYLPCSHLLKHDPAVWDGFVCLLSGLHSWRAAQFMPSSRSTNHHHQSTAARSLLLRGKNNLS